MKINFNIAVVCIVALLCIAAVTITGLAMGHDGMLVSLSFVALGAIPASVITWFRTKKTENGKTK